MYLYSFQARQYNRCRFLFIFVLLNVYVSFIFQVSVDAVRQLDRNLFETYIERRADPIAGSLEPGIYAGYFDWKDCQTPTGTVRAPSFSLCMLEITERGKGWGWEGREGGFTHRSHYLTRVESGMNAAAWEPDISVVICVVVVLCVMCKVRLFDGLL